MGSYLSEPITAKESSDGVLTVGKRTVRYGVTAMQGWRVDMEDNHCVMPEVIENTALLSVFDGHGGREVAAYCARHIPLMLAALKTSNYDKALKEVFLECDRVLLSEAAVEEMQQMLKEDDDDDDSETSDEDTDQLMDEAEMPLEQLLARYGRNSHESEGGQSGADNEEGKKLNVSSVLLALANKFGVEFDDTSSEEDSDSSCEREEEEEDKSEGSVNCGDEEEGSSAVGSSSRKRQRGRDNGKTAGVPQSKRIADTLLDANRADEGYHSGTTAIACLVQEDQLIVANAGDSRCVLSSGGKAEDMSIDHSPTVQTERNRIEHAGGNVGSDLRVNGGLNLSRAIGDHFYKENTDLPLEKQMITALPDVRVRPLTEDDEFVVIACDGIWNVMESQAVVDFVHDKIKSGQKDDEGKLTQAKLSLICEQLCDSCLAPDTNNDGTGCDNMTCIIALLKPSITTTQLT